jgi:hypothetical protein
VVKKADDKRAESAVELDQDDQESMNCFITYVKNIWSYYKVRKEMADQEEGGEGPQPQQMQN